MLIVADSSPLISLAILGLLESLNSVFSEIIVPVEVFNEISYLGKPFSKELTGFLEGKVYEVENKLAVQILRKSIDAGESEAIVLAIERNCQFVLMDDFNGRRTAELNGLNPIGTLGVLLKLKKAGKIERISPHIDILLKNNIRISEGLRIRVLNLADE